MTVIIGIDPHKVSHAACAIDNNEHELAQLQVRADNVRSSSCWVGRNRSRRGRGRSSPPVGSAICSPSSSSARVSVWWMCRRRCRRGCGCSGSGRSNKNDPNDARAVAVAALRAPSLAVVRREDHVTVLRLLAKAQLDTGRARSRACCRLHALARELVAGGIRKEVVVSQAEPLLAGDRADRRDTTSAARARPRAARRDPRARRQVEALQDRASRPRSSRPERR